MLSLLPAIFLAAFAYFNIRSERVPNWLLAVYLLAIVPAVWIGGWTGSEIKSKSIVFLLALFVALAMFERELLSGGTGKLIAVTSVWLPFEFAIIYSATCAILLGIVACAERYIEYPALVGNPAIGLINRHQATIASVFGLLALAMFGLSRH